MTGQERDEQIRERLSANADLTEKALDFMADPEQIEEAQADIALWREAAEALGRVSALETALRTLLADFEWLLDEYPEHEGRYSDERIEGIRALLAEGSAAQDSGGDPVEVHPAQSLAERQSELNGPSGSPTSPPGRAHDVLTWISDPSYVGNYSPEEVVAIYRKWAHNALAAEGSAAQEDTNDGD